MDGANCLLRGPTQANRPLHVQCPVQPTESAPLIKIFAGCEPDPGRTVGRFQDTGVSRSRKEK